MFNAARVKVQSSTRDLLHEVAASRSETTDQVVSAALEALQRDERRSIATREARAIKDDPVDLAEIEEIRRDIESLNAG